MKMFVGDCREIKSLVRDMLSLRYISAMQMVMAGMWRVFKLETK